MEYIFLITGLIVGLIIGFLVSKSRQPAQSNINSEDYNRLDKEKSILEQQLTSLKEQYGISVQDSRKTMNELLQVL